MSHPRHGSQPPSPRPSGRVPAGQGGLRGWLDRLRRFVGGGPKPPEAKPADHDRATGGGSGFQLPASWQLPERPAARVSYKRDRLAVGSASRTAARERTIQRQILLALIAIATVGVVSVVAGMRYMSGGTLPVTVRGVWRTDGPRYEERLFELAGSRIAFQTSDSTADIFRIRSVHRTVGEAGTTFDVEYEEQGATYVFTFIYSAGPPEELRFVHQPFMVWTRTNGRQTLMPQVY